MNNVFATPKKARKKVNLARSRSSPSNETDTQAKLSNYALGDCLGKGAHAIVYRALNVATGETVAVKQIKLADVPKADLDTIMMEIHLLKNLNHPNIVKYHGFVKTSDTLSIILEYCENGSLSAVCKKFGRFPESLVAVYIYQVLQGLAYLHSQGAIHRDVKGANILTTKNGVAKLADFGVATRVSGREDVAVVGTPNWMAPEIIELNGATTASDVWSLGCTIVELLTGQPPYYNLRQMPTLFAIVNDEHPPIPAEATPVVKDFLLQCFQKDPNLRMGAKELLKHPWMRATGQRGQSQAYEDAVKSVQRWNYATRQPVKVNGPNKSSGSLIASKRLDARRYEQQLARATSSLGDERAIVSPPQSATMNTDPYLSIRSFSQARIKEIHQSSPQVSASECWDLDFHHGANFYGANDGPYRKSYIMSDSSPFRETEDESYDDLEGLVDIEKYNLGVRKEGQFPQVLRPSDISIVANKHFKELHSGFSEQHDSRHSRKTLGQFKESDDNDSDFLSAFDAPDLSSLGIPRNSAKNNSLIYEDSLNALDDIETSDLASNAARDHIARVQSKTQELILRLKSDCDNDELISHAEQLHNILTEYSAIARQSILRAHGLLAILEVLDRHNDQCVVLPFVLCLSRLLGEDMFEYFSTIGGFPILIKIASQKPSLEVRAAVGSIIYMATNSRPALRMFAGCGGLQVLAEFCENDFQREKSIVTTGVLGMLSVFRLDMCPKYDICRILSRCNILDSLSRVLCASAQSKEESPVDQVLDLLIIFSEVETPVKEKLASRTLFRYLFKSWPHLTQQNQLRGLKFIKNMSFPATFQILQNADAIEFLVNFLVSYEGSKRKEVTGQVMHIMFNLCRLSPARQEEAALCGFVPVLQDIITDFDAVKQLALPTLCDMVHASKLCRNVLWSQSVLSTYLSLTEDPYWQVNAYEALYFWLKEEKPRVEERLCQKENCQKLLAGMHQSKSHNLNAVLNSIVSMLRLSDKLCACVPIKPFFTRIRMLLKDSTAVTRLNLLRLIKLLVDTDPTRGNLLDVCGLTSILESYNQSGNPVMVQELSKDLLGLTHIG